MKNWKTTLAGLITGLPIAIDALIQAYNSGYFTEKDGWQLFIAIGIILFTALSKDHDVSGTNKPVNASIPPANPDDDIVGDRPGSRG